MAEPTEKLKMRVEHDWLIIPCHNGTTWRFHLRLGHEARAALLRADLNAIAPGCCEVPAKVLTVAEADAALAEYILGGKDRNLDFEVLKDQCRAARGR